MAQEDKRSEKAVDSLGGVVSDETTLQKKRARRRLIGASALALLAAIVLPMVMDHQPGPPLKDIQVKIPSPDEGVTQRGVQKPIPIRKETAAEAPVKEAAPAPAEKPVPKAEVAPVGPAKAEVKSEPRNEVRGEVRPEAKPPAKPEPKVEVKAELKSEAKPGPEPKAPVSGVKNGEEAWEVQLGAYKEPGRVKLLAGKLKELGLPYYTEDVETPAGARTRVRAGPFPTQEAAERARGRIKIIGVDGPVARKP